MLFADLSIAPRASRLSVAPSPPSSRYTLTNIDTDQPVTSRVRERERGKISARNLLTRLNRARENSSGKSTSLIRFNYGGSFPSTGDPRRRYSGSDLASRGASTHRDERVHG